MLGQFILSSPDGWTAVTSTWTYASASTITVPTDATLLYSVGDRIRFTQTTVKYGVIVAVAATTLTIAVNTDYVLANAAISAISFSKAETPVGYPQWFNYTPTLTGFSADPAGAIYQFNLIGKLMTLVVRQPNSGTSNTTGFSITLPVVAATITDMAWGCVPWDVVDNGAAITTDIVLTFITSASTTVTPFRAWTASGGKRVCFTIQYRI